MPVGRRPTPRRPEDGLLANFFIAQILLTINSAVHYKYYKNRPPCAQVKGAQISIG
jgi:hypothetical protein